ncbi:UNKNOWN [Stylonychia lemnae]|uniref:Transmembrane protein n=1 Tax=Stylonychia lemnae TaxID=5949 RepID=A0A077ZSM8_STYLE|nr:UNKNOWN [Stylonychia lemnae]|eukprot:CDW72569.1 UNKNOWN [Stylonychia lemnae]
MPSSQGAQEMLFPLLENQGVQALEERKSVASFKNFTPVKLSRKTSTSPYKQVEQVNQGKAKLLTAIERKITYVPHAEYIKKSDVTLGDKSRLTKLTIINMLIFILQMVTIIVTAMMTNVTLNIFDSNETPITIDRFFLIMQWILVFVLQFIFVLLPLPCMRPAIIAFTSYSNFAKFFLPFGKVIYKDDGRDFVSFKEFISIHVTFSVFHAWITYFCIFNFFRSMGEFYEFQKSENKQDAEIWNLDIELWGVIAMTVMLIEMSIYLAYYKDVMFSITTLLNYVGMFIHNNQKEFFTVYVHNALIGMITITSVFIFMTIVYDYDKAFYLKHRIYDKKFNVIQEKLNQMSKDRNKSSNQKDENPLYERSQSFAVWLQFRQIQDRKVRQDTDAMTITEDSLSEHDNQIVEEMDFEEIQDQQERDQNLVQSLKFDNVNSHDKSDIFDKKAMSRQKKQAFTVMNNSKNKKKEKQVNFKNREKSIDQSMNQMNKSNEQLQNSYASRQMNSVYKFD